MRPIHRWVPRSRWTQTIILSGWRVSSVEFTAEVKALTGRRPASGEGSQGPCTPTLRSREGTHLPP